MKKQTLETLVGLFVALGLAAVVFLSFRVAGGTGIGSSAPTYTLYAQFSDIGGLKVKAPVKSAGVVVGRVGNIQLDPESYWAKVTLNMDAQYRFSTDVSAQILTSGLLGEQYIGLMQGGDVDDLADGDVITITSSALVLEQLIGKFMTSFAEGQAGKNSDNNSDNNEAASGAE
ncbi:phospholipid/cholesterol/gamma-HCH transport system substrate-binding protein [Neisseria sp. HSC-16F19]|nr:outer membrane lipid asymmetry maintenance protein MlaD [Neisseria sp. HSC-16F19]MCP2040366.1 phospholipid/cholesterol/gamma-HCH transport system substrate-binding protein [Neisseria sp. HSC-16F19]